MDEVSIISSVLISVGLSFVILLLSLDHISKQAKKDRILK